MPAWWSWETAGVLIALWVVGTAVCLSAIVAFVRAASRTAGFTLRSVDEAPKLGPFETRTVEAALEDEGVPRGVRGRVLERLGWEEVE